MVVERTYEHALRIIKSRQRPLRPTSTLSRKNPNNGMPASNGVPTLKGSPSILGMTQWLQAVGHSTEDIDRLNVIHITGTKGKGSTCAFAETFLRVHGRRTGFPRKTGLYTSPHLMYPEERIRINSRPISRSSFAKYFFELYDRLPQLASPYDPSKATLERGPRSLQLYALLAFHVFIREHVDVSVIETHSGGEYDATNLICKPVVTAVTTLGMDHVDMLGPSIENIAWHKGGIYKAGSSALSTQQDPGPARVLEERAAEKGEKLTFINEDVRLPKNSLQLQPEVQRRNASLAIAATEVLLGSCAPNGERILTQKDIFKGIDQFTWPGRFQVLPEGKSTWFLDSAHNDLSAPIAARWFTTATSSLQRQPGNEIPRILIFSHINELRDTQTLLETLAKALADYRAGIQHVIFTTYDETGLGADSVDDRLALKLIEIWKSFHPQTQTWSEPTIQGAIARARTIGRDGMQTLITGSQHLVGPSLRVLKWEPKYEP